VSFFHFDGFYLIVLSKFTSKYFLCDLNFIDNKNLWELKEHI